MKRYHKHFCVNRKRGCQSAYECADPGERDEDGTRYCSLNPMDEHECEDCDTSRCSDCGSVLNVEKHDVDCPKATAWAV